MKGDVILNCSQCKDDGALYQVAQLAMRPELNLQSVTNITNVSHMCLFPYEHNILMSWKHFMGWGNIDGQYLSPPLLAGNY